MKIFLSYKSEKTVALKLSNWLQTGCFLFCRETLREVYLPLGISAEYQEGQIKFIEKVIQGYIQN